MPGRIPGRMPEDPITAAQPEGASEAANLSKSSAANTEDIDDLLLAPATKDTAASTRISEVHHVWQKDCHAV